MGIVLIGLYLAVLLLLCGYGLHRARLAWLCFRYQPPLPPERLHLELLDGAARKQLPFVTVQLPIYNEATVVQRLLEAAGRLDYPRDKLEIQVLDDSDG